MFTKILGPTDFQPDAGTFRKGQPEVTAVLLGWMHPCCPSASLPGASPASPIVPFLLQVTLLHGGWGHSGADAGELKGEEGCISWILEAGSPWRWPAKAPSL